MWYGSGCVLVMEILDVFRILSKYWCIAPLLVWKKKRGTFWTIKTLKDVLSRPSRNQLWRTQAKCSCRRDTNYRALRRKQFEPITKLLGHQNSCYTIHRDFHHSLRKTHTIVNKTHLANCSQNNDRRRSRKTQCQHYSWVTHGRKKERWSTAYESKNWR